MTLTKGSKISSAFAELEFNLQRAEYIVTRLVKDSEVYALEVSCATVEDWGDLLTVLSNTGMSRYFYATYPHEGRSMITEQPLSREDSDKD